MQSRATTRGEYLRRPELGRTPADLSHLPASDADIGTVLADGLSPRALAGARQLGRSGVQLKTLRGPS